MNVPMRTLLGCVALMWTSTAQFAHGQDAPRSRVGGDTVVTVRATASDGSRPQSTVHFDSMGTARVLGRLTVLGRTVAWRNRTDSEWFGRLVQLTARYEAAGRVGLRIEAGFLGQPVGLSALQERANENPLVLPALPFDVALPAFDAGVPRLMLPAPTWPLGLQVGLSGLHWDVRGAVVDSSPLRSRTPLAPDQPAAAAQLIAGGGVTFRPGLRVGGWWQRGPYAKAREIAVVGATERSATLGAIESEFAMDHFRMTAEWMLAHLETTGGTRHASAWTVEGTQTLTPRWFVAARARHIDAPFRNVRGATPGPFESRDYTSGEVAAGYRFSPDITVRASVTARQPYAQPGWFPGVATEMVWARRWF
ncbi:MAG: hypothetical protein AB7I50_04215 [Vicinamibacterales bacterium]